MAGTLVRPTLCGLVRHVVLQGGAVGMVVWAVHRRSERFTKVVESCAYYLDPFEWSAYRRDDHWPPSGKVHGLGWRNPIVRPRRR